MTTTAKKVGGPKNFVGLILGSGVAIGMVAGPLLKKGYSSVKAHYMSKKKKAYSDANTYKVCTPGVSNEGVIFSVGECIKVLEADGDAVLVEKVGDAGSPYFISEELLKSIICSDMKEEQFNGKI